MGNVWWFCKVEFLCYANEPNWLGWIVIIIMEVSVLSAIFFANEWIEETKMNKMTHRAAEYDVDYIKSCRERRAKERRYFILSLFGIFILFTLYFTSH